jgi:hypothetical protein
MVQVKLKNPVDELLDKIIAQPTKQLESTCVTLGPQD